MSGTQGGNTKKTGEKRKRVVLSIENKLKILKLIDSNVSYTVISQHFDIGRSTVCDISRKKDELLQFSQKMVDMGAKNVKTMKVGEYEELDEALYIWFCQQHEKNVLVSGQLLMEKARILFLMLYGDSDRSLQGVLVFSGDFASDME